MAIYLFKGSESPLSNPGVVGKFRRFRRMLYAALGAQPAFRLNFSVPLPVGIGGNGTFASTYATDEWFDFSTATVPNNVGTETLANTGGLLNRSKNGLYNGTSYAPAGGWEVASSTGNAHLASSAGVAGEFAFGSEDFAFRVIYRSNEANASDYVISKFNTTDGGWRVYTATSGRVYFGVYSDTASSADAASPVPSGSGLNDGAWHEVKGWYDSSANLLYIKTDLTTEASASTAAVTGGIDNTQPLEVNGYGGLTSKGQEYAQYAYAGVSVGANAQNFYNETCVLPGADPTGLLTTISRPDSISVPVSATQVAKFASNTLPIGYNANFSDVGKFGLYCNSTLQNLVLSSESLTAPGTWNPVTCTVADNVADAPDGFRSAGSMTATADSAVLYDAVAATENTQYTFSTWVKRNGGTDVAGRIKIYDQTNATFICETTFTATDTWQLVSCTGTTGAGCVAQRHYMYIDTNTESLFYWGMKHNPGDARAVYIKTTGAPLTITYCDYEALGAPGAFVDASIKGEIEMVWTAAFASTPGKNGSYLGAFWGTSISSMVAIQAGSGSTIPILAVFNSSSTIEANLNGGVIDPSAQENTFIGKFDPAGGLEVAPGAHASVVVNGSAPSNDIGTYTAANTLTKFQLGNAGFSMSSALASDICVQSVRTWRGER